MKGSCVLFLLNLQNKDVHLILAQILKHKKVEIEASILNYAYDLLAFNPTIWTCQGCMSHVPIPLKELVFQRP
jgi:hypothetical protein